MVFLRKLLLQTRNMSRCHSPRIDISPEVEAALNEHKPVVALESTIITHGMPNPQNLITALAVEDIIREQGVVPATIGVVDGRVKVGLNGAQVAKLADPSTKKVKISRRDFPYVISHGLSGGTTVSGTIMIAKSVGINIFVTGGIGGVHKNGENTMDISADLNELGMNSIMTVCSGVKSILDIEKTLEYLETEGVCVASFGPSLKFPAFYSQESRYPAPYHVETPNEAAKLLQAMLDLKMNSGVILAVPVPKEFSIDNDVMEAHISLALRKAETEGKSGKEITPFVLNEIANITKGKSLEANIALIKNNALVGAKIAQEHSKLVTSTPKVIAETKLPVVIGGSNVDSIVRLQSDVKLDGRTLPGTISQVAGGVGRNIADALGKLLSRRAHLVSAVGTDQYGDFILDSISHLSVGCVDRKPGQRTACYTTVIDKDGETRLGVGDMEIHQTIGAEQVAKYKNVISNSSVLVLDGNISVETIDYSLKVAQHHGLIVWFEPTDSSKADKPFRTSQWKSISLISPNLNELRKMAETRGLVIDEEFCLDDRDKLIEQVKHLAVPLANDIPVVMVTMGTHGVLMASRVREDEPVIAGLRRSNGQIYTRYYKPRRVSKIENTSGAGDCTASGYMSGVLQGLIEAECLEIGLHAGQSALSSHKPVPDSFKAHNCTSAFFTNV